MILQKIRSVQEKLKVLEETTHQNEEQELLAGNDLTNDRTALEALGQRISQLDGQLA